MRLVCALAACTSDAGLDTALAHCTFRTVVRCSRDEVPVDGLCPLVLMCANSRGPGADPHLPAARPRYW